MQHETNCMTGQKKRRFATITAMRPIHTLNARENVYLGVTREHFRISSDQMYHEIQMLRLDVEEQLALKDISYTELKTALVPDHKRREVALIFDSRSLGSSYGFEAFKEILPLLNKKSNHIILAGDYIGNNINQEFLYRAFCESIILKRSVNYRHSSDFFVVYINNLSHSMVEQFDRELAPFIGYVGYVDSTYGSAFKYSISTMLTSAFVKHRQIIIQGHPEDTPFNEDNEYVELSV